MIIDSYKDFSIDATLTDQGNLKVLSGQDALENALRLWIASFRGEINRKPYKGGYVTRWLTKPMTETVKDDIREAIIDGISDDFFPSVKLRSVEVLPNYDKGFWEIHVSGYSPEVEEYVNVIENIRAIT